MRDHVKVLLKSKKQKDLIKKAKDLSFDLETLKASPAILSALKKIRESLSPKDKNRTEIMADIMSKLPIPKEPKYKVYKVKSILNYDGVEVKDGSLICNKDGSWYSGGGIFKLKNGDVIEEYGEMTFTEYMKLFLNIA